MGSRVVISVESVSCEAASQHEKAVYPSSCYRLYKLLAGVRVEGGSQQLTNPLVTPASVVMTVTSTQTSPHVLVVWRPDMHTYTAHIMQEVDAASAGPTTCKMNNADLPKVVVQGLGKAIQLWQEDKHVS